MDRNIHATNTLLNHGFILFQLIGFYCVGRFQVELGYTEKITEKVFYDTRVKVRNI